MKEYPNRPSYKEEKYVDYDEDTTCYGIFGLDSGFCYELYSDKESADERLDKHDIRNNWERGR